MRMNLSVLSLLIVIILTGCGTDAASSADEEKKSIQNEQNLDAKWLHRMEQRGLTDNFPVAEKEQVEQISSEEKEASTIRSEGQVLIAENNWRNTSLKLGERAYEEFEDQTIGYFKEDMLERYPPVLKDTVDMLATMIKKDDEDIVVTGVIRNGFKEKEFKRKELEEGDLTLVSGTMNKLAESPFDPYLPKSTLEPGEALPFRHRFKDNDITVKGFDYDAYGYYLQYKLPKNKEE